MPSTTGTNDTAVKFSEMKPGCVLHLNIDGREAAEKWVTEEKETDENIICEF
jgi:hypothetical protein